MRSGRSSAGWEMFPAPVFLERGEGGRKQKTGTVTQVACGGKGVSREPTTNGAARGDTASGRSWSRQPQQPLQAPPLPTGGACAQGTHGEEGLHDDWLPAPWGPGQLLPNGGGQPHTDPGRYRLPSVRAGAPGPGPVSCSLSPPHPLTRALVASWVLKRKLCRKQWA